jgi:hypothetical protein
VSDGTPRGDWLGDVGSALLGSAIGAGPHSNGIIEDAVIEVNQMSYPHLGDHAIDGAPVVPVVYAVEWFARAARNARPDLFVREISDLKVLKGIALPGFFDGEVTSLLISTENEPSEEAAQKEVTLILRLADLSTGRPHYSCRVWLTADAPARPTVTPLSLKVSGGSAVETDGANRSAAEHYGGVLFHGADFQVLNSVVAMGAEGCAASVDGVIAKAWDAEPWVTDPALLDGGLQLALLWNKFMVDRASLPTSIESIRLFSPPVAGSLIATLSARESRGSKSLCDIVFSDVDGTVVAQLLGVETHSIPAS